MNRCRKAFTLVEIMVVVVIIGLLATIALPAFRKVHVNSQRNAIINNLRQLSNAGQQYLIETGQTSVTTADLVGTTPDKYIKLLSPVAQENYDAIVITTTTTQISVTSPSTGVVTYSQ